MNNPAIQQTLVELQDSLAKIESARTQVNNISEKSEQLISSFTSVLESIESISDGVGIDKTAIKENLDKGFKKFTADLKEISNQSDARIKDVDNKLKENQISFQEELKGYIKNFESAIKKLGANLEANSMKQLLSLGTSCQSIEVELKEISKQSELTIKELNHNLKENQVSFQEDLKTHSTSLKSASEELIKKFESKSEEQVSLLKASNQDLISEITNVTSELISFQNNLKRIEKEITELDFEKEFNLLSTKIDLKHKQSLILNSVLFLLIIIILFATK